MTTTVYAIAFLLGAFWGTRIQRVNPIFFAVAGAIIAVGLGNYPYYPLSSISTTMISSIVGFIAGNWGFRK